MQSFDTKGGELDELVSTQQTVDCGFVGDIPTGSCKTIDLPDGRELSLYNIDGEFHAVDNICPHKGAPLNEGILCAHIIECGLHGWQFDVRTGECLTVTEKLQTYEVVIKEGVIKVLI
jgi:nitrite reductase/ring-hydroxylating ferredoxin subunit